MHGVSIVAHFEGADERKDRMVMSVRWNLHLSTYLGILAVERREHCKGLNLDVPED